MLLLVLLLSSAMLKTKNAEFKKSEVSVYFYENFFPNKIK